MVSDSAMVSAASVDLDTLPIFLVKEKIWCPLQCVVPSLFLGDPNTIRPDSAELAPANVAYPASENPKIVAYPEVMSSAPFIVSESGRNHRITGLALRVSIVRFMSFRVANATSTSLRDSVTSVAIFVTEYEISYLVWAVHSSRPNACLKSVYNLSLLRIIALSLITCSMLVVCSSEKKISCDSPYPPSG